MLTAGYIGLIALGMARRPRLLRAAAPAGRMSLTVYIGESALLSLLFSGYGLGYFGQWGAFAVVLSGIAAWAVLSCFAWLWMRNFGRGPLETILAWATGARTSSIGTPLAVTAAASPEFGRQPSDLRHVDEPRVVPLEGDRDCLRRSVAVLGHDEVGLARPG